MKVDLDKFYTKKEIAKQCIELLDLSLYDTIIEPSAGNGSFSSQIKNCIAYDIEPEEEHIIQQDFFLLPPPKGENILIIGNPPFGERCKLAKAFIKKSIDIGAKTIAFILPNTFNKFTNQKIFPKEWKLIQVKELDDVCFEVNGKDYYVPCSFFVWSLVLNGNDLREKEIKEFDDFAFLSRGDKNADFVLNGNSGKIRETSEVTNPKAEHYIKLNYKKAKSILERIDWEFNSSVNGGVAWLGKQEIIKQYILKKNEIEKST